jgi:hypothetical protein
MRPLSVLAPLLLAAAVCSAADSDKKSPKPAADLPEVKELPDPFTFADGKRVKTKDDWKRRREEIKSLFEDYEYGHLPPKPKKMTVTKGDVVTDKDAKVSMREFTVKMEQNDKSLTVRVRLAWPDGEKKAAPVVIQSSFGKLGKASTKPYVGFTKRGYAVAECSFNDFASDNKAKSRSSGIYELFGDKIDCGALMAWAWGVHRVIDVLESVPEVDSKKIIVTGHSRYGKAALVAGAFDERIALTVPSHSGCGGAAPYRFIYGKSEQLHNVVGFTHWFHPDFKQFVGKVNRLPVDQHELIALVAPRAVLLTEGTQDAWTNPEGSQLTHLAAKKVFDFLKAGDKISVRYRPVGHVPNNGDLMDFADHVFFEKELSKEFGKLAYKEEKKAFTWDVPK